MANLKVGLFEISPQSGNAGTVQVGHKLAAQNTGRNKHMKLIRASILNPAANKEAIETLEVEAMLPFLTLDTPSSDIAYDTVEQTINVETNAEKFRVSSTATGKNLTLKSNTGYTVSGNEGTMPTGFGQTASGEVAILVGFTQNAATSVVKISVLVEIWDGSAWVEAGTFLINQGTADSGVTFVLDPATIAAYLKEGGEKTIEIDSNIAYTIEKQGSSDMSWLTLSRTTGIAGKASLTLTASAQAVGNAARNLNVVFKNAVTGSTITTLAISQVPGDAWSIAWEKELLSFTNEDVGEIQYNNLTANDNWSLEEDLS